MSLARSSGNRLGEERFRLTNGGFPCTVGLENAEPYAATSLEYLWVFPTNASGPQTYSTDTLTATNIPDRHAGAASWGIAEG